MSQYQQSQPAGSNDLSDPSSGERDWTRAFWLLLGSVFAFRLIMLAISPLDLSGDEAYYWDWGRHLDWGYYSKPPMIAWLMALASHTTGATTFGIRLWALLFATGTCVFLYRLAKDMFGSRAAFFAGAAATLGPAVTLLSQVFTIDPPLMFFWSLALWASWRLVSGSAWSVGWALVAGLSVAAGVLTKQMMLVFPLLIVAFLIADRPSRRNLGNWRWWALVLLPVLALIPPLAWNAQHGWITLEHTGSHFDTNKVGFGARLLGSLGLVAIVALMVGPVTFVLSFPAAARAFKSWGVTPRAVRFLAVFCLPALVVFLLLSLRQRVLPNWPAVYLLPLFVLFGGALAAESKTRWWRSALWVSGSISAFVYAALLIIPQLDLKRSPLERVQSWKSYAQAVAEAEQTAFRDDPHFLLVAGHRYYASHLAFYHPERPTVYRWEPSGGVHSQYEIWPGFEHSGLQSGLLVVPVKAEADAAAPDLLQTSPDLAGLASKLVSAEQLGSISLESRPGHRRVFALFRVERKADHSQTAQPTNP